MNLTQDFAADFDAIADTLKPDYRGRQIAFSRFGDGEYAILRNMTHVAKSDGWKWQGGENGNLRESLFQSLIAGSEMDDYFVGISAVNHHPLAHAWYLEQLKESGVPMQKVTFASLFIFANYDRFLPIIDDLDRFVTVGGSERCDYQTPKTPDDPAWQGVIESLPLEIYVSVDFTDAILVSAGPWASVLIHRYWQITESDAERRQTIIDCGSTLDEKLRGRRTRHYHDSMQPQRQWVPRFSEQIT